MSLLRREPAGSLAPARFSIGYKLAFGVASFGTSLISGVYGAMLAIFYQDYLGLAARWIAIASIVYAVWNAINDPLFGYITDSTRSPLGRRIPYLRYTAPFLALTFILLWFAPPESSDTLLFTWMLATMLLFDTCYTIIGLVYSSLLPEVTESDAERNELQISSSLFALVGMLFGFMIPNFFRPKLGSDPSFFPLQMAMVGVGVAGALAILVTAFKVRERPVFTQVDKPLPIGPAMRFTLTSRSFLVLVAANFMTVLMTAMVMGALFYLADYVLQIDALVVLIALFVPLVIGVPSTSLLRRRLGVVGAQQVLLLIAGIGLVALTFVPRPLVLPCLILAGFGLAGPQTLTNVLFAQVVDEDELRSGVRREGAFFGVNALITKPAQSIALALIPMVLHSANFLTRRSNAGLIFLEQPESALLGIRMLAGLIPGLAMLAGALILFLYPLRGSYLERQKERLLRLHAEKQSLLGESDSPAAGAEAGVAGSHPLR